jgi:hypothetical protein
MTEENFDEKFDEKKELDPKEKFRLALEKKKKGSGIRNNNVAGNSKIHGDQTSASSPQMFRRKSGSA